jgi:tetratricopeptide (TPR) repeat protein
MSPFRAACRASFATLGRHLVVLGMIGVMTAGIGGVAFAQSSSAYFEFLMARRLEAMGDQAGALAALERAAVADPASAEVRAEIASFQLRRNRRTDAESAALQALKLDEANLEAHRVLGLIYAGNVDGMNARTPEPQVEVAARQAITHLERASADAAAANDIQIHYALGRLYLRVGEAAKAIDAFTRVVNQNPDSAQGLLSLSQAYAANDELPKAIESLEMVVEDEPRVAAVLAQYQEQAGQLKEAVQNYTRALAVEPMSRALKFRRIAAVFNDGNYAQAAAFAGEAQAQHPEDLRFPRLRARAIFESGDPARAVTILEPVAKANPRDTTTQIALADLYNDAGRDADAERTLRLLLTVEPQNAEALNYLGYLLANRGRDLEEAVRLVERALVVDPGNPAYLDSLGWAHFQRGDLAQAEKFLSPAAEKLPRNAVVQDHLGDMLARQGRWPDAIAAWTRALDGDGGIDRAVVEKKIADARAKIPR